ncbi:unnamed protein product [Sphagnum tenellum]
MCETVPWPGVTKSLKWAKVTDGLELLDALGVLLMQILDQARATRLVICNDNGEAFLEELAQLLFWGDVNQAVYWVLQDCRVVKFGCIALERPPSSI